MKKYLQQINEIRNFLDNDEIQDELSVFNVDLSPELEDNVLAENFARAVNELPSELAKRLKALETDLAENSRAAEIAAGKALATGRLSMTDRAVIIQETVAAFSRGLEDLRAVAADFSEAIELYKSDDRPLLERQTSFENVEAANRLLADLWQKSVEVSRRLGLSEFRRLTHGDTSEEVEQLRNVATGRFVIDKEISEPMREFAKLTVERENALRIQRDAEFSREKEVENEPSADPGMRLS